MCKKYLLILVALSLPLLCYSEEDSSQDALQQINSQAKLAQNIVVRLVESLSLREATLLKEQENLNSEKAFLQQEKSELLIEKESLEKQKKEQEQIERTLANLRESLQKSSDSLQRDKVLMWGMGGITVASLATTTILLIIK